MPRNSTGPQADDLSAIARARAGVTAVFVVSGFLYGSFASRIPALRDRLELSDGELGLALVFGPIGALIATPVVGAIAASVGSRRATRATVALSAVAFTLTPLAPSLVVLCGLIALMGAATAGLDVSMNLHGVEVERRLGRPILSGLHAGFSIGGLLGAGVGALAAGLALELQLHLGGVAILAGAIGLLATRSFLSEPPGGESRHEPRIVLPPRPLWALGAVAFMCLFIEGAAADWSGVYLRDDVGTSAATAGLGIAAFNVTMVIGRLSGDRLVERLAPDRLVRAGAAIAGLGFAFALIAGGTVPTLAGFAALGAGISTVVPIVFRAAGDVPGVNPGIALAAVSTIGYCGFIAGPPLIGAVAELAGLPPALAMLTLMAAAMAALASTIRRPRAAAAMGHGELVPA